MPKREIALTEKEAELVEQLVSAGRYRSVSEVLQDGLRLVEQRVACRWAAELFERSHTEGHHTKS